MWPYVSVGVAHVRMRWHMRVGVATCESGCSSHEDGCGHMRVGVPT